MRDLYATTMQLLHVGDGQTFEVAVGRALRWAWRVGEPEPNLAKSPTGTVADPASSTSVAWSSFGTSVARAVEIRLQHPDERDESLYWQASTEITEIGGATKATVRLALGASVYALKPMRLDLKAPSLVRELMQAPLRAYVGSIELDPAPRLLKVGDARELVVDVLEAPERALPVLVAASGVPVSVVNHVARGAAGLVQLARAYDDDTDEALRAALERSGFTVPRGGFRLFWPGFGSEEGIKHPYWTKAQVRDGARDGVPMTDRVVRLVAPISTARVPLDRAMLRARQEAAQQRIKEQRSREEAQRQRQRRQRAARRRSEEEKRKLAEGDEPEHLRARLEEMEALLALAEKERDDADVRAAAADEEGTKALEEALEHSDRAAELENEVADLRRAIRTMNEFESAADHPDESDSIPEQAETWDEIAEHLSDLDGPGFAVTDAALVCADVKNRYPNPGQMWRSLRALERVGRAYNERGAKIDMRFEAFATEIGEIEVALQDSTYGDCWFEHEGKWYERVPHVKVDDAKSPNEVGRIYFALDPDGKRVIVDWFGTKPDRPNTRRPAHIAR